MQVEVVELGGARLHMMTLVPGLPGEATRVKRDVAQVDPAVVLLDIDTSAALRLREAMGGARASRAPPFLDALVRDLVHARYGEERPADEDALEACVRVATERKASLVPLRAVAKDPGFFARRRAKRLARDAQGEDPFMLVASLVERLEQAGIWRAAVDAEASRARCERAVADGRSPVLAVVQAHRAPAFREVAATLRRVRTVA